MVGLNSETVSWSLKNILISLLPFIVGATLRIFYFGEFSFKIFSPSELAFSMAILFIIVFQSVSLIDDSNLKLSLSVLVQIGIFISLALFACSLILKIHLETELITQFNSFEELSKTNPERICELIQERNSDSFHAILNRVNWGSIIIATISIPTIIGMKIKYKLN